MLIEKCVVCMRAAFRRTVTIRGSGRKRFFGGFLFLLLAGDLVWNPVQYAYVYVYASEILQDPISNSARVRLKIKPREESASFVGDSGEPVFSVGDSASSSVEPVSSGDSSIGDGDPDSSVIEPILPVSDSEFTEQGTIVIQCSNVENNDPLEGCIFEVSSTGDADYKERVYTDSLGSASLENVPFGTCIVKQIGSTEGFVSDENSVSVVLNSSHFSDTCTFNNSQLLGTLTIKVADEKGSALVGQKIKVTNLQEDVVVFKGSIDGSIELKLPLGFYKITLGKKAMAVTLNASSLDQEVTLVKVTKKGFLNVQFYDFDTHECVSDGIFSCTNLVTGESQSFTINSIGNDLELSYGEYSIQQTTASSGYQLNDSVYNITINSKKSSIALPVSAQEDGIISFQLSKESGEALSGIELDLLYAGSIIASGKTNQDGGLIFTGVPMEYKYSYRISTEVVGYEMPKMKLLSFTSNLIHNDLVFKETVIPVQISVVNEKEEPLSTRLLSVKEFDSVAKKYQEVRRFFSSSDSVLYLSAGLYKIDLISMASQEIVFSHEFDLEASMHPIMFVITETFSDKISYRCNDAVLDLVEKEGSSIVSGTVTSSSIVSGNSIETGVDNPEDLKTDQEILENLGLQEQQIADKQVGREEPKDYTIVFVIVVVVLFVVIAGIVFGVFILPKLKEKYYKFRL